MQEIRGVPLQNLTMPIQNLLTQLGSWYSNLDSEFYDTILLSR